MLTNYRHELCKASGVAALVVALACIAPGLARAAQFEVQNLKNSGKGSLRQAILDANARAGADVIVFRKTSGTISLSGAEVVISDDLTVEGPGADSMTISVETDLRKNPSPSRVLSVSDGVTAEISGLTLANGRGEHGGAVANGGTLTLTGCILTNNHGEHGGAVANGGTLTLTGCILTNNYAEYAGAVDNRGTLTLTGCILSNNSSSNGTCKPGAIDNRGTLTMTACTLLRNYGEYGGAMYNTGTATVTGCTLHSNEALPGTIYIGPGYPLDRPPGVGGAILNHGTLTISNSTVSGNVAYPGRPSDPEHPWPGVDLTSRGGGILNSRRGTLTVINCTITDNDASWGSGIYNTSDPELGVGVVHMRNTVLAGNGSYYGHYSDLSDLDGNLTSSGYNLIGNGLYGGGFDPTDLVGTPENPIDPMLGPLQDNGGPTPTHALLPGSPAIDAADNESAPDVWDQRGAGFPRITNDWIDIGAFEFGSGL